MKIRKNDKVVVLRGKDKGKTGLVISTFPQKEMVLVEGVNTAKKHKKADSEGKGELITITRPIHISKVMLMDGDKKTKVGYIEEDGKKFRVAKKTNQKLVNIVKNEEKIEEKPKTKSKSKKAK